MAYYFLFPEKDTTLYSHPDRKELNAGSDEILEILKERGSSDNILYPTRALIKFKTEELQTVIGETIGHSSFNDSTSKVSLQLTSADPKNLLATVNLSTYAVSESWDEGTGRYSNLPTSSNGASWVYRNNTITATKWTTDVNATWVTYASGNMKISEMPSSSEHQITINGIDFIPVLSSSIFDSDSTEVYVDISSSISAFGTNLINAFNASSSLTFVTGSFDTTSHLLALSASTGDPNSFEASGDNIIISTSSVDGNDQGVFARNTNWDDYTLEGGSSTTSAQYSTGTTGSISSSLITKGGGTWYTGSDFQASQQFLVGESLDTDFDVTTIVKKWSGSLFASQTYPDGIENQGLLIKKPEAIEANVSHSFGELQYFSVDTHTVYPPKLTFKWDDSMGYFGNPNTQDSNFEVDAATLKQTRNNPQVVLYNNQETYNQNDVASFRFNVRDKYPTRTFATSSNYLDIGYFWSSSCYSIRDAHTEQEIIPFDSNFTKLSADSKGNYFNLHIKGLQPERYYRILIKQHDPFGTVIHDNDYYFKVIR